MAKGNQGPPYPYAATFFVWLIMVGLIILIVWLFNRGPLAL